MKKAILAILSVAAFIMIFIVLLMGYFIEDEPAYMKSEPDYMRDSPPMDAIIDGSMAAKPVIYLYPAEVTDVTVKLDYDGILDYTYPVYDNGWTVTAYPDGTIINHNDGLEYSYLFWEGHALKDYDFSKGFVVKGSDTIDFLQENLAYMGLTPREYNEFIVFWLPQMQSNPYNIISFQESAYTDTAKLAISPEPDCILRVFMTFKPIDKPVELPRQVLTPFERNGFTVVEWGGSRMR